AGGSLPLRGYVLDRQRRVTTRLFGLRAYAATPSNHPHFMRFEAISGKSHLDGFNIPDIFRILMNRAV
ncbi:MAG: hypothetical protein IJ268_09170, partial [Proteobacteria bacterium]|nr:hypothetical protein [Pseudomonadota bacterium]